MLKPIGRRVLIKTIDKPAMERHGSLVVPTGNDDSRVKEGVVIDVGRLHKDEEELLVKKDDRILFIASGHVFTRNGEEYRIIEEGSIIVVVEEDEGKIVTEEIKIPKPPKEGRESKGGVNERPKGPKPDITPAAQNPKE